MLSNFQFHHIGIAVNSIKTTAQYYLDTNYTISDTIYDPIQNVSIAFLEKNGMPKIELVEAGLVANNSPVSKIIEKSGVSLYHICYEVNNIESAIRELKKKKYLPLANPVNAVAMNNRKICFLYNKDVGLIELVEYNV
jgi:methylmalonyl-CoA/ethylmalonyl-CoA epimerase